ncbi:MAG: hypothetical protein Q8P41_17045 [Pseudomonadota bacterium]|nr:hypothetical protein [Pseudomonadota bacterium]
MSILGSRKRRAFLVALVILIGIGAFWRLRRPRRPPPTPVAAVDPEPVLVRHTPVGRTTVEGAAILGINEGISLPERSIARFTGGEDGTLKRRVALLRATGARMVRANSHAWPHLNFHQWKGDWTEADRFMGVVGAAGLDVVLVIGPWPGTRTSLYTNAYVPADLPAYQAWVEQVVERYDGDGLDDMPGLARPVLGWEVDNEPDQHNQVAPRGAGAGQEADGTPARVGGEATGRFETPAEYAQVLIVTSQAIRRADPEARVLSGGLYRSALPAGRAYLAEVLAVPGARDAIDVLSLHCYFSADNLDPVQRSMRMARALAPGVPVWITETSVPSAGVQGWVDEEWQAQRVAGIIGGFLAEGADRIFWHTLVDAPNEREGPTGFATNSLFRGVVDGTGVNFEPKPSGDVFRRIAGHLRGQDPESFVEVAAEGGRLLETDAGWLAFDGAPAVPDGSGAVEDLRTGEVDVGVERAPAPAWIAR